MLRYVVYCFFCVFIVLGMAQAPSNLKEVSPEKGEGIYSLLLRNKLSPAKHMAEFLELNKEKLGHGNALLDYKKYALPAVEAYEVEPLFGDVYSKVKVEDFQLKGAVFYLVAGHGGPDPGALGKYGEKTLSEDEYAYDITLRLGRRLMEHGAKVHMVIQDKNDGIRDRSYLEMDKDEICNSTTIPLEQVDRLRQRAQKVNSLYRKDTEPYRRCVILHLDSRSKGKNIDVFFYHHKNSKEGKKLAYGLLNTFDSKYKEHQPTRGYTGTVSTRNLYMLKKTFPSAVFIELGNIRNFRDQQRFILENNRQALANWLCEGIISDHARWSGKK